MLTMDQRPFSIFSLSADQAITLLETPAEHLEDPSDRYIAAAQLVNHPSERAIAALMGAIATPGDDLDTRIVRRKAVETLGYLQAEIALPLLQDCLRDSDPYTIDNAVWSIGEIGRRDPSVLAEMTLAEITQLLAQPGQNHRLIVQALAQLGYVPAAAAIGPLVNAPDLPLASAAMSALYQLTGDATHLPPIVEMLQHSDPTVRRSCIQDLMDAQHYDALVPITQCPVSVAFRLRGIRQLATTGLSTAALTFRQLEPLVDRVIQDHPRDLVLVHEYDQPPSLDFAINELYATDFGRCYLATETLLAQEPAIVAPALMSAYHQRAQGDYGAHYHVIKLLGWLRHAPALDLFIEALHNPAPQFQKSRTAAAIALGILGNPQAISALQLGVQTDIWALNYACLMALTQLGAPIDPTVTCDSDDCLVQAKYRQLRSRAGT